MSDGKTLSNNPFSLWCHKRSPYVLSVVDYGLNSRYQCTFKCIKIMERISMLINVGEKKGSKSYRNSHPVKSRRWREITNLYNLYIGILNGVLFCR